VVVPLSAAPVAWRAVLFGKLPSHGDFVCRGMSDTERAAWDTWTAEGFAAARDALGEGFDAAHSAAPLWQFISGPGRFGESWRAGCFAPSTDRAGRRFVAVVAVEGLDWGEALAFGPALTEALADAVYRIFAELQDADGALETISACAANPQGQLANVLSSLALQRADGVWWSGGGPLHAPAVETGAVPDAVLLARALTPTEAPP
jgi:type VI secretion system protein ImpM